MEICVPGENSACLDISSCIGSSTDPHNPVSYSSAELCMNDLKTCLTELLENVEIPTGTLDPSPGRINTSIGVRECECRDLERIAASDKCLSKRATFPPHNAPKSPEDLLSDETAKHKNVIVEDSAENGPTKPLNRCFPRSTSLPTPSKLVSAMKGRREKQDIPGKKLSVSWAPEVYDPIPTSVSHVPSSKYHRSLNYGKKAGKNKHKGRGKSSQGSSSSRGKEKKQGRKNGRGPCKFMPCHEVSGVHCFGEATMGSMDYDNGIPDLFCGSSLLMTSVAKLQFPVAEAK